MQDSSLNQKSFVFLVILIGAALVVPHANAAPILPDRGNLPNTEPQPSFPPINPPAVDKEKLPEFKPALDESSAITVTISKFTFTGNSSFSEEQLAALLVDFLNRPLDIKALNQAMSTITQYYRKHGFLLAQAYLPEQDIAHGALEVSIIEGKLGELKLKFSPSLDEKFLKKMASNNLAAGDTIREDNLVKNVTILNSLPALRATAQLDPGEQVGTSNATIDLQELPRWNAIVGANTYGNQFTGREVAYGTFYLNNLAGRGDQLTFGLSDSKDELQRTLQLGYAIPVHDSGTLLSLNYYYEDYRLDKEFASLDATGDSQYFSALIDQPILRSQQKNLTARFGTSYKDVTDEVGAFNLNNHRDIEAIDFGAYGDWRDKLNGFNQLGLNIRYGHLHFKDAQAEAIDAASVETAGNFIKYNLFASRIQPLSTNLNLILRAEYQGADQNLDSSEQFSIGGINRWRAFADLPTSADRGLETGIELRGRVIGTSLAELHIENLSPYAFVDYGTGVLNQNALSDNNHVDSVHYGLGVDANFAKQWLMGLTISRQERRIDGNPQEDETRAWGQIQKEF
jgi:hemolysin activation/secretion protein